MANRNFLTGLALALSALTLSAAPFFQQAGNVLVMSNGNVTVDYNLNAGTANFYWQNVQKMSAFFGAVSNRNSYLASTSYPDHGWAVVGDTGVVVTNSGAGLPTLLQYFTFDQTDSFLTSISLSASTNLVSNWMAPVMVNATGGVDIGSYDDDRALFVPFDNDHFVSYNSESINGSDTGNEAGAFYDNTTRTGLVVGSVTHDTWKTGVYWSGSNDRLNQLSVFGGVTSHWTWDVMPHGSVSGMTISSPTIFVGFGNDWRTTMENFANENTLFAPRLAWTNGVPFGWNSWGVTNYQADISYSSAIAVSDSIHTNLQPYGFTNGNTVYVNLDSYWNNLSDSQLQAFTAHCHANGQKAGVYWGPFVFWGNANDATNYYAPYPSGDPLNPDWVYRYSDLLLRDGSGNFISNDGAYAIDPTHPGTLAMIDYYASYYAALGFDYVKLDFLSHGALEGVHYNPAITTGIQAYNLGMQRILSDLNGKMFISESISPIFPYQYGNSRRIACDAQASEISDTAYTMNGVSLGWWISGRLYQFNDPDLMVFDNGPNNNECQSRLINGAITGLFLNGSILTNAASISLAQMCLTNPAINSVARMGQTFRPVDGASGTGAANILAKQAGSNLWYIAVFNYGSSSTNDTVLLSNAGLPAMTYNTTDLWTSAASTVAGSFSVSLGAKQARLFSLVGVLAPPALSAAPVSYTNAIPMYSGVPVTLSVAATGPPPLCFQWYQIADGVTNAIPNATNSTLTHWAESDDNGIPLEFFVVVTNNYGSITSSVATVALNNIMPGIPDALSVQYTLTNYAGYAGGFFLAPTDTAGVYAVSNWNVFAITPAGGGAGTQPGVTLTNLMDRFGVMTPAMVSVVNVSDGWHQTAQTITSADTANARMMNTFWKTYNDSSPNTNVLYTIFTNIPNGIYSAYVYFMQNNAGATGYIYSDAGVTNYFSEFTAFTSSSNFVTSVDTNGNVMPFVNYLRLTGLSTGNSNSLILTTVWTSGADGIGVSGVQLVPPLSLTAWPVTNGQFSLQFTAPDSQSYVVESSTNLTDWIPVVTNSPANGRFVFLNTNATDSQHFYRIRQ